LISLKRLGKGGRGEGRGEERREERREEGGVRGHTNKVHKNSRADFPRKNFRNRKLKNFPKPPNFLNCTCQKNSGIWFPGLATWCYFLLYQREGEARKPKNS
jgi:hypothetical protein